MITINLYGGPGSGKSTIAAGLFSRLKLSGINAELVTEYAKDKAWESPPVEDKNGVIKFAPIFDNQIYIFAKQHHRLWRLNGQVDIAITDSPLLLSAVYNDGKFPSLDKFIIETYHGFNNLNYFLNRTKKYNPSGRNQNEEQAKLIDIKIKDMLKDTVPFIELDGNESAIITIANKILDTLNTNVSPDWNN